MLKWTIRQLGYIVPLVVSLGILAMGSGCPNGTINVGDRPADSRFEGRYIHVLAGEECGDSLADTCETSIWVAHVAEPYITSAGEIDYHSGLITLVARQTGTHTYQDWEVLQLNGAIQVHGWATGTLLMFTINSEGEFVHEDHAATVTLEGESEECPEAIRVVTDDGELDITAERTGDCL